MNTSQINQLRDALHRETQDIEPVGLGVERVVSLGRRRRNRGRAVVAVGAATCVAGFGAALVERGTAGPQQVAVAASAPSGGAATPALEFRVVDGTVAYSSTHFTSPAGVTYELSTAPGTTAQASGAPGQAIYSTTDGQHWTTAAQDGAWITDLAQRDGVLYAVGTAPGAASPADVQYRVGTSHNGGAAWTDADLPFDLTAPSAKVPLFRTSSVHIASGPTATIALLTEDFSPNLDAMVAARTAGHPTVEPRQDADGYALVDMSACQSIKAGIASAPGSANAAVKAIAAVNARAKAGCADAPVLGTITWSDLGLTGPGDLTRQEMLSSTDGTHWSSVPAPSTDSVQQLAADAGGFLLLSYDNTSPVAGPLPTAGTTLLRSADGRTWTKVSTPDVNVQAIADDRIVGEGPAGAVETSTDGGSTWNTTDVSSLLPAGAPASSISSADAGPLGFAVVVSAEDNGNNQVRGHDRLLFSTDGVNWTTSDLAAAGAPAGGYPAQVTVGADHVGVDYEVAGPTPGGPMKITTVLATPKR